MVKKKRAPVLKQDNEHLKLLSLFHFILAGLFGLSIVYSALVMALSTAATSSLTRAASIPQMSEHDEAIIKTKMESINSSVRAAWYTSHVFIIATILMRLVLIGGLVFAGHSLNERTNLQACMAVAIISCLAIPLGTALGVFTIVVLQRPSVKRQFA